MRRRFTASLVAFCMIVNVVAVAPPALAAGDEPVQTGSTLSMAPQSDLRAAEASEAVATPTAVDSSPTVVRELFEKRTATSKTHLLTNGALRAEIWETPVHYRDQTGEWQDIDTSLVPDPSGGGYVTKAAPVRGRFGSQTPKALPVQLEGDGYSVGLDMLGTVEGAKTIHGDKARYLEVAEDTDLEYESLSGGLKETLILSSAEAPTTFRFSLKFKGVDLRQDDPGQWALFKPGSAEPELRLGALSVFDSSQNRAGDPAYCTSATMTIDPTADGATVTYRIPQSWLADPARVFPVKIDPTLTANLDTFVSSAYPDTVYGSSTELKCGYYDATTGHNRALVKFDLSSIPANAYIDSATFKVHQFHIYDPNNARITYLGRPKRLWSEASTWNTLGCIVNNEADFIYGLANQSTTGLDRWIEWNVASTVQSWVSGDFNNYGFVCYQDEGDPGQRPECWRKFRSSEWGASADRPKLVVDYDTPYSTVDGYVNVYRLGGKVAVSAKVRTPYYQDVKDVRVLVNYNNGNARRGYVRWSTSNALGGWSYTQSGSDYFSYYPGSTYGSDRITFLPNECSVGQGVTGGGYKRATLVFKINGSTAKAPALPFDDVQDNDFDTWFEMNNGWNREPEWETHDTNVDILPDSIRTTPSFETSASQGWFAESDPDGDGVPDNNNDSAVDGRGSVDLTWTAMPLADGYRVYLYDGNAFRQVGQAFGNESTSWSTSGRGIFAADTDVKSLPSPCTTNALAGVMSPGLDAREATVALSDSPGGAGVVLTDGTYLYVRAWSAYPGPTRWTKYTKSGTYVGTVGADYSSKRILSGFYRDGFLYSGYAESPTSIKRVSKSDGVESTFNFQASKPLIKRDTGQAMTGSGNTILLAAEGDHIYSVAYGLGGTAYEGYFIREYVVNGATTTATWVADHSIDTTSFYVDGVIAAKGSLYLLEWGGDRRVLKIRTGDFTRELEWMRDTTYTINGCWDPVENDLWVGALDQSRVHRYTGPGLDLRDDPHILYNKTNQTGWGDRTDYRFAVVPYNDIAGEAPISEAASLSVDLDRRSFSSNDDPRHTEYAIGGGVGAQLDQGTLTLDATDLQVASWGPAAALDRHYTSASTESTTFAPGWRFGFEQRLDQVNSTTTAYLDPAGDAHVFRLVGGQWRAPVGYHATLGTAGSDYRLMFSDQSYLTFGSDGVLKAATDDNNQSVSYAITESQVTITAANGKVITVERDGQGRVTRATYTVDSQMRRVDYALESAGGAATATVAYYPGTSDEYSVRYTYESSRITSIDVPGKTFAGAPADVDVTYGAGPAYRLESVTGPEYQQNQRPTTTFTYGTSSEGLEDATVTASAEVSGTLTNIYERYAWNRTGTLAYKTNPRVASEPERRWTYSYTTSNELVSEKSPTGKMTSIVLDREGNPIFEYDEDMHLVSRDFNGYNRMTRETDQRGGTTYFTYGDRWLDGQPLDDAGNLESAESVLNCTDTARSEFAYDSQGRQTIARALLGGERWISTFSDYTGSVDDQPTMVTQRAQIKNGSTYQDSTVALSTTETVASIVVTKEYDGFGNLTGETLPRSGTDPNETVTFDNASYSISGLLLSFDDVDGVTTHQEYDALGRVIETSQTVASNPYGKTVANRGRFSVDPNGRVMLEESLTETGSVNTSASHTFDPDGRETSTLDSVSGTTTSWYDARGNAVAQWAPAATVGTLQEADRSVWDLDERQLSAVEAGKSDSAASVNEYRPDGLVAKTTNPDGSWVSYEYDDAGAVTRAITPTENTGTVAVDQTVYDLGGRPELQVSSDGLVTRTYYDLADRPTKTTAAQAEYDEETRAWVLGAETTASAYTYNELGWPISTTDADGIVKSSHYDVAGNVIEEYAATPTSTVSHVTTEYDAKKRPIFQTTWEGAVPNTAEYVYDPFGRTVHERHSRGSVVSMDTTTTYDEFGRETAVADSVRGISHVYDYAAGAKKKSSDTATYGSLSLTSEFDSLDRETTHTATAWSGGIAKPVSRLLTWDTVRNVPTASGVTVGSTSFTSTYSYDAADKLTQIVGGIWGAGGNTAAYNAASASKVEDTVSIPWSGGLSSVRRTFGYSTPGRLTTATIGPSRTIAYSWDPSGTGNLIRVADGSAITTLTYSSGHLATMTRSGAQATYTFDSAGRRTRETTSGGSIETSWTGDDRLISWARKNSGGSVVASATYAYDADGQRTSATVFAPSPFSASATVTAYTFGWEGLELRFMKAESAGASATISYLFDQAGGAYAAAYEATRSGETTRAVVRFVTSDHGEVVALADEGGTTFAKYSYGPFGEAEGVSTRAGTAGETGVSAVLAAEIAALQPLRYAGYDFDSWSGHYYLQARYYDPATRQFLSKDPSEADGEESAYQYCSGDPINAVDPTGEWPWDAAVKAFKAVVAYVKKAVAPVVRHVRRQVHRAVSHVRRQVSRVKQAVQHAWKSAKSYASRASRSGSHRRHGPRRHRVHRRKAPTLHRYTQGQLRAMGKRRRAAHIAAAKRYSSYWAATARATEREAEGWGVALQAAKNVGYVDLAVGGVALGYGAYAAAPYVAAWGAAHAGEAGGVGLVARVIARNPLAGTSYSDKVRGQMSQDIHHGFPSMIDDMATGSHASVEAGAGGRLFTHVRIPGAINGQAGNYHYIIDSQRVINHRLFDNW